MKIELPLYQTAEGVFNSLTINFIVFPIKDPQKCSTYIFRLLLNNLWLLGVFAYPHENRLYFVFQVPHKNILEEFDMQISDFVKRYSSCFPEEFAGRILQSLSPIDIIKTTKLSPAKLEKDFKVVRFISYRYFNKIYAYGKKGVEARRTVIYLHRFPEDKTYSDEMFIRQGIKLLFEVSSKGRGRIWFDVVTHAFKIDEQGNEIRLSHSQMKQESMEFYKEYLSIARMKPKERYGMLIKMLGILGIQDRIEFKFYIWNVSTKQFDERNIVFGKYE